MYPSQNMTPMLKKIWATMKPVRKPMKWLLGLRCIRDFRAEAITRAATTMMMMSDTSIMMSPSQKNIGD